MGHLTHFNDISLKNDITANNQYTRSLDIKKILRICCKKFSEHGPCIFIELNSVMPFYKRKKKTMSMTLIVDDTELVSREMKEQRF